MRTLALTIVAITVSSAAFAQAPTSAPQTTGPAVSPQQSTQAQPPGQIAQQIRKNLEQAGFKDIKLMPSSFLVRAQDKDGHPVMMVINPDLVTSLTEVNPPHSATGGKLHKRQGIRSSEFQPGAQKSQRSLNWAGSSERIGAVQKHALPNLHQQETCEKLERRLPSPGEQSSRPLYRRGAPHHAAKFLHRIRRRADTRRGDRLAQARIAQGCRLIFL